MSVAGWEDLGLSPETGRLYQSDWTRYLGWCESQSLISTSPYTVKSYVEWMGKQVNRHGKPRYSRAAIRRAMAAIRSAALLSGDEPPTADPIVLRAIKAVTNVQEPERITYSAADLEHVTRRIFNSGRGHGALQFRDRLIVLLTLQAGMSSRQVQQMRYNTADLTWDMLNDEWILLGDGWMMRPTPEIWMCGPCTYYAWREIIDSADMAGLRAVWEATTDMMRRGHICHDPENEFSVTDQMMKRAHIASYHLENRALFREVTQTGSVERYRISYHAVKRIRALASAPLRESAAQEALQEVTDSPLDDSEGSGE